MRLEPDPLDPVGTGLKTGDVNPEVRDMMLLSTRLCVWNPDVVVPPSELPCHDRRLMVQSLSVHPRLSSSIPLTDCDQVTCRVCRTLKMSRAPLGHDRTDRRARRLRFGVMG